MMMLLLTQKSPWPKAFWLVLLACLIGRLAYGQQPAAVSGQVQDEQGQALIGVSVKVENGRANFTDGTTTDGQGRFAFQKLPPGGPYSFTFTYIGYEPQTLSGYAVQPGQQVSLPVKLKVASSSLNEVVVVGYGTQKKVNLTGAVSQIDAKTLEDRPIANITQAIQGAVPNLNVNFGDGRPGSNGSFNIRGNNPISGGSPLVIIDGVPGTLNLINPRDVETISVLRDAASSAIYGARGAAGVILITTKKAKKGKVTINYNNNFSFATPTVSTDFMTSGYDAAKLNDEAFLRAVGKTYTGYTDEDYAELLKRKSDPSLPAVVVDNRNGKDMYIYYGNTDWWHTMFRDVQPGMEHSLSFSGGTDKVDYFLSGRSYGKRGMMKINQDIYKAYNLRAKINAQVAPWLHLSSNTQFNTSQYTYPGWSVNGNFVSVTVHALPSYVPVNPDGTATYRTELNNYTIGDGIYADLLHGKSKGGERNYDLIQTFGATVKLNDNLDVVGNYTYNLTPASSFYRRTESPWSIFPGQVSYIGYDQLNESMSLDQYHVFNGYANYSKTLGQHAFKAMAGYNQELKQYKNLSGWRKDLLSEELNELNLGAGDQQIGGSASEWALMGAFFRLNYDYKGRYLLEMNGRYDGTSRFPKASRFGFFPSVSAGWRISEEPFFAPFRAAVNELKLRASYGSLGNQQVATYAYIPVMKRGTLNYVSDGSKTEYLTAPDPISPNLTWETITSTNAGIDFGLLDNRLTGSFDWYTRNTTDMLTKGKTLPEVFGAPEPRENAADLQTKGYELVLNWRQDAQLANKPFSYNFGLVLSDYKSTITRFDNPSKLLNDYYVGQQLGQIWGYSIAGYFATDQEAAEHPINQSRVNSQIRRAPGEWGRLRAGDIKFRDLNGDKVIDNGKNTVDDHGDLKVIGNSQQRYPFGINGGASWNGFDLSVFFQGIGRQHWYPGNNADKFWGPYSRPYYSFIPKDFNEKVWSEENPNAYFPRLRGYVALNGNSELNVKNDKYLQDLAYIRLKNLTLGYSLPAALISKVKLNRARVYFSGENVLTFTRLETKYIDPEQASAEANGRVYPFSKSFSFGLDLTL